MPPGKRSVSFNHSFILLTHLPGTVTETSIKENRQSRQIYSAKHFYPLDTTQVLVVIVVVVVVVYHIIYDNDEDKDDMASNRLGTEKDNDVCLYVCVNTCSYNDLHLQIHQNQFHNLCSKEY